MGRKKKMKQEKLPLGTIYQAKEGGNYYLRYQIQGKRKNVNLKTDDYDKALEEYNRLLSTLQAMTVEVVAAHVKNARQLAGRIMRLALGSAWEKYSVSPDRAMPATIHEQQSYQSTFQDFVDFIGDTLRELHTITYEDALEFTKHMKTLHIAVDTHNRRVLRLRKIFSVLKEFCNGAENPFGSKTLLMKKRVRHSGFLLHPHRRGSPAEGHRRHRWRGRRHHRQGEDKTRPPVHRRTARHSRKPENPRAADE